MITVLHTIHMCVVSMNHLRMYVCILCMDDDSKSLLYTYVYVSLLRCGM